MFISRPRWLTESGPDNDVVLATRCRIARNLASEPFPWRAAEGERKRAAEALLEAAHRAGGDLARAWMIWGDGLGAEEMARLLEWRYASWDWTQGGSHRWLLIAPDAATSLLVNEEDHVRLQTILPGLQVESVWVQAERRERELASVVPFAWSEQVGFLTVSLTNAGTGLRISALLHLAGLAASETREAVLEAAAQVGCAVRGLYGEGTQGTGELFQVSNTCAFGLDARQIAGRVESAARYLIAAERRARQEQFGTRKGRAALKAAAQDALRRLFREEASPRRLLPLVSVLRLAVTEGVLPGDVAQTAGWIALAGAEAAGVTADCSPDTLDRRAAERFEAVRRSAALRQRLRNLMELSLSDSAD